ncbi:hypothetical protein GUJ93_ZPchr0013g34168 [Zizania palustris]|uniref:Uncharacterized protein n=1 Tax=Zizania palustris TaxID=103762 RepID=A0A8J5X2T6_ZIZPA|nr:hypothetical protein GUJ93_ZPchr0013g34168 [Zizania palustris]
MYPLAIDRRTTVAFAMVVASPTSLAPATTCDVDEAPPASTTTFLLARNLRWFSGCRTLNLLSLPGPVLVTLEAWTLLTEMEVGRVAPPNPITGGAHDRGGHAREKSRAGMGGRGRGHPWRHRSWNLAEASSSRHAVGCYAEREEEEAGEAAEERERESGSPPTAPPWEAGNTGDERSGPGVRAWGARL